MNTQKSSAEWGTYLALNKLLKHLPQSTPGTPTQGCFPFSSTAPNPVHETPSVGIQFQHSSMMPLSTTSLSTTHYPKAIPTASTTSLKYMNLPATLQKPPSPPLHQSQSPPEAQPPQQRYSPSLGLKATKPNIPAVPFSIARMTGSSTVPSEEVEPTPLTPLSPYSLQQGRYHGRVKV